MSFTQQLEVFDRTQFCLSAQEAAIVVQSILKQSNRERPVSLFVVESLAATEGSLEDLARIYSGNPQWQMPVIAVMGTESEVQTKVKVSKFISMSKRALHETLQLADTMCAN